MEADYGIPYFCGLPLERYGLERWLSRFSTAAKGAPPEKPVEHETGNRTLLLIGAPIATEGLAWAIRGEYPNCRILRAFYAPYRTLKELYRPFLTADTLLFGDPAELARLGDARCPAGRSPLFPLPAAVVSTGGAFWPVQSPECAAGVDCPHGGWRMWRV